MTLAVGLSDFMSAIFSNVKGVPVLASVEQHFKSRRWRPEYPYPEQLYVCISTVQDIPRQQVLQRRETDLVETRLIVLDDVGTKVEAAEVKLPPSYILETSPGNFQWGYILKAGYSPGAAAALIEAIARGGLTDMGSRRADRIVRVPGSLNVKYDKPFHAVMHKWEPQTTFTLGEIAIGLDVKPGEDLVPSELQGLPDGATDPVLEWLDERGMLVKGRTPNARGWIAVHCFREEEHSGDAGHGADYHPGLPGAFRCLHDHAGEQLGTAQLTAWIKTQDAGADIGIVTQAAMSKLAKSLKQALGIAAAPQDRPPPAGVAEEATTDYRSVGEALRALAPQGTIFGPAPKAIDPERISLARLISLDLPKVGPGDLPDPTLSQTRDQLPLNSQITTAPRVHTVMDLIGMTARLNVVSGEAEISVPSVGWPEKPPASLGMHVLEHKCATAGMNNDKRIAAALNGVAEANAYSPVEEWIDSAPWDGTTRLPAICATLVPADPSQVEWRDRIVVKALRQVYAALTNWRRGDAALAVGFVLVLQGAPGIGKTWWIKSLMPPQWVADGITIHLAGTNERDTIRKATLKPLGEIGELDNTFARSEQSALKNFLTRTVDTYRLAYAPLEVSRPRGTAFMASVNSSQFLMDETGERRYWPLAVRQVDSYHTVDLQQLWAEIAFKWRRGETDYKLDRVEELMHKLAVAQHTVDNEVSHIVDDLVARHEAGGSQYVLATCRQLCRHPEYDVRGANKRTWNVLATMLEIAGFERRRTKSKKGFWVPDFSNPITPQQRALLGRLGG